MSRWLVAGAGGMLGRACADLLASRGHDVVAPTRDDLDITDPQRCLSAVDAVDVVVNCAGWTAVDAAEGAEAEAFWVNAVGVANLARAATARRARLVHVSTDYVFDGGARVPYAEGAPVAPRSAYGRTKAAGEWAARAHGGDHLVVRTAWLYGDGPCFPRTIARLLSERETVRVVNDQLGQPTWSVDVADVVERLVATGAPAGTYHATAGGRTSWHAFAREVAASLGADPDRVGAVTSQQFLTPAPRPAWSVLGGGALRATGIDPVGDWRERWAAAAPDVLDLGARPPSPPAPR